MILEHRDETGTKTWHLFFEKFREDDGTIPDPPSCLHSMLFLFGKCLCLIDEKHMTRDEESFSRSTTRREIQCRERGT